MKFDKSLLQRSTDKFVIYARELSSRGTSFLIVLLGVILQASHTTLLMYNVSAFDSAFLKAVVSLGIGIFISMALAVFTLKHDGKNETIGRLINIFFYFEVFTNLFYYFNSILLDKGLDNLVLKDYIFFTAALPFAYIMPYAIKQFAGVIAADKSVDFGTVDIIPVEPETVEKVTFDEVIERLDDLQNKVENQPSVEGAAIDEQTMIEMVEKALGQIPASTVNVDVDQIVAKVLESVDVSTGQTISKEDISAIIDEKLKNIDTMPQQVNSSEIKSEVLNAAKEQTVELFKEFSKKTDERYMQKGGKVIIKNAEGKQAEVDIMSTAKN